MQPEGIIDAAAAGRLATERILGVPLVGWAAHRLYQFVPIERITVMGGDQAVASWAARHGLRHVQPPSGDTADPSAIRADPRRPFLIHAGREINATPIQRLFIEDDSTLELARAVAIGLPPDHPCIRGIRRWRLPINKTVRAIVTDVDGVLTDGGIHFTGWIRGGRVFNTKDGLGHHLLAAKGIKVGWLSATSEAESISGRAQMLGVEFVDAAKGDKGPRFDALCQRMGVLPAEVVYLGDDVNDLPAIERAGLSACPADAHPALRARVDLVLETPGGHGCLRELAATLLDAAACAPAGRH
ncbi:MAG TPA: HAD family hydrolase [Phycisphaerales bacterium]|nr:HAD family hydrolase [Phycisphaerales bacterium]